MAGVEKSKIGIGNIVSWGATIVIIGLLFKIQHWRYSEYFITLGLGAEAVLFFLIGFQQEPVDPDWTLVYPELKGDAPAKVVAPKPVAGTAASLDKLMADAKIGPELISSLGEGLKSFGDKVSTITKVADAGTATQEFTTKIKAATISYDNLNTAFTKASAGLIELGNTNIDSKAYHDEITKLAKNLSSLNAVYELELQDSNKHLKSMSAFYENLGTTMKGFTEAVDDSKRFKDEVSRLAKNVASLNSVYGNMLSAMNAPIGK
ncbi:gliding motility-associated protein GldL [Mucilaginibacter gracilis]|uniref:Gliding motility-associated protein GldL n=1 Tax=Mucilaginibacter gracilis TaxID=423350 RepID=A0A495IXQ5_9SPHI|nr:gliding motility protein GldL [Mucilaginibacter gracilis]RKR80834.1 gliding motility-associated protein GldL [Mucilaginibacter gracilis]